MLKVWGRANSLNVQKVMWTIAELGLAHERIDFGGKFGGNDSPEYLAKNPNGLVPLLEDGDTALWESHAIVRYLAAKHGAGSLWPDNPTDRAPADQWMEWAQTTLQPATISVFMKMWRTPPGKQDPAAIAAAIEPAGKAMTKFDAVMGDRPFPSGNTLTFGDIAAGAHLFRYFTLDIERPNVPNVERWYAALTERPAYAEHVMVSYDDLRAW